METFIILKAGCGSLIGENNSFGILIGRRRSAARCLLLLQCIEEQSRYVIVRGFLQK